MASSSARSWARGLELAAALVTAAASAVSVVPFPLQVRDDNRERTPPLVRLKAVCGADRGTVASLFSGS
jgi:hypothetical protein